MNEIYCDGVSHVILSRGLVSIEYFHLVYDEEKGKHKREPFISMTLPLKGALEILGTGEKIMKHMIKVGALPLLIPTAVPENKGAAPAVETKAEKKNAKSQAKPAAKPAPAPAKKAEAKPTAKPAPAPVKKAEAKPAAKPAPAPAKKAEAKPASKPVAASAKKPAKGKKPAK